jgi:hypothetical protein
MGNMPELFVIVFALKASLFHHAPSRENRGQGV